MAGEVGDAGVSLLAGTGGMACAKAAVDAAVNGSATKPARVVFVGAFNPHNLARSSGNATGVTTSTAESLPERRQLLEKLVNRERAVALLIRPNTAFAQHEAQQGGSAAQFEAGSEAELNQSFAQAKRQGHSLIVGADAFFTCKRNEIRAPPERFEVPP